MVGELVTGRISALNVVAQANIADIDVSTVDTSYGQQETDVLTDLQTKVQTLIDQLEALGLLASS